MRHLNCRVLYPIIIIMNLFLTGCVFTSRIVKLEQPKQSLYEYEKLYLSEDKKELIFNINVKTEETNPTFEKWCATLPVEEVLEHSKHLEIDQLQFSNFSYLDEMDSIPIFSFNITKSACDKSIIDENNEIQMLNNINDRKYNRNYFEAILEIVNGKDYKFFHLSDQNSIFIVSDNPYSYNSGQLYFFAITKFDGQNGKYRITKISHPIKRRVYNKLKFLLLPVSVVADVFVMPVFLLLLMAGGSM